MKSIKYYGKRADITGRWTKSICVFIVKKRANLFENWIV